MKEYTYITLRQKPQLKEQAAIWFHDKWGYQKKHIWNVWKLIFVMRQNMAGICAWMGTILWEVLG